MKGSNQSFADQLIEEINKMRQDSTNIIKKCEAFKNGASRLKASKDSISKLEKIITSMKSLKKIAPILKNKDLTQAAVGQMSKFLNEEKTYEVIITDTDKMKRIVQEKFYEENPCLLAINAEDLTAFECLCKLISRLEDSEHIAQSKLCNAVYTQIGVAHSVKGEDNFIVIVIAETEGKEIVSLPEGDLTELKQAFDLFDINQIGKIDINETIGAMKKLNMDMRNPELFKIMKELDEVKTPWIDFPTFATHIMGKITDKKSTEGLRTIFNLFRDDMSKDEITIVNMMKIVTEIGEVEVQNELKKLLNYKGGANAMITFEEFEVFMEKTYSN